MTTSPQKLLDRLRDAVPGWSRWTGSGAVRSAMNGRALITMSLAACCSPFPDHRSGL
jgi:hypothetical protein